MTKAFNTLQIEVRFRNLERKGEIFIECMYWTGLLPSETTPPAAEWRDRRGRTYGVRHVKETLEN